MVKKINWKILISCFVFVYIFAALGSLVTNIGTWYESVKPSITPPNYVFPIVWNILFFLIAISLYIAWTSTKKKKVVGTVFGVNLLLNFLWSVFFFGMQNPILAFFELIFLWLSIVFMIFIVYPINKKSAYLLAPYLAWVFLAGILNYLIAF